MIRTRILLWCCLFAFGFAIPAQDASAQSGPSAAGAAKIDITPDYALLLSGYAGRTGAATEVSQRLGARALAIGTDAEGPAVLIAVDNVGVPQTVSSAVARALEEKFKLPRSHVAVCSTHTHNAPMLSGVLPNLFVRDFTAEEQAAIERYTGELTKKLIDVAAEALANRQPAKFAFGKGVVDFSHNRRQSNGPVDHSVPVLQAVDAEGKTIAIVTSYACHAVALGNGNFLGGDWPGYAVEALEAEYEGAIALVLIGCGGDQNPIQRGGPMAAQQQGRLLASAVQQVISGSLRPVKGMLTAQFETIKLPFAEPPTLEQWKDRAKAKEIAGYHARRQLRKLEAEGTLPTELAYPVQTWSFGDSLAMVLLGGEVVVDYSHLLYGRFDATRLWVTAYSNDVPCYIPSERVLNEGGYEGRDAMVWYDQPGPLLMGVQSRIVSEVTRQLPAGLRSEIDTSRTGGKRPLTPAESMAAMKTHDDLRVELVAAEPLVVDPVAIDFGPDGRLWVAEMHDYPEGLDGKYQPGGRIKFLEDTDGDGHYDKATQLLDDVPFPTGVMAWRNGALVCAAPDVFYIEDTNGDGQVDVRQNVLTGFTTHNYQARVNSLALGLDNWIYGAGGIFGGVVQSPDGKPADTNNRDFRMQPDRGIVEAVSGRTQQGRARDDWGNWFGCENSEMLSFYPLTESYYARQPNIAPPPPEIGIAPSNRVFPRGQLVQFALSGPAGVATSACGLGIYRDTAMGAEYLGNSFVCEPVNQLVHRLVLSPAGTNFRAERASDEAQTEFLTSTDNWFRPVQVRTGPDGGLWVVDMYRYVIEHPRFIADEVKAQLDLRAGDQRGRIYRVVPSDSTTTPAAPNLRRLKTSELVRQLNTTNGTRRDAVHLELLWRKDAAAVEPLRQLAADAELPQTRLHALCILDAFDALTPRMLLDALADEHAGVRRHAVRLAEPFLSDQEQLLAVVRELAADTDAQVRLQVAYSLGAAHDEATGESLAQLAMSHRDDPYLVSAVLSSLDATNIGLALATMYRAADPASNPLLGQVQNLAAALGADDALGEAMDVILAPRSGEYAAWQYASMPGILKALADRDKKLKPKHADAFQAMVTAARAAMENSDKPTELRLAAARVLPLASDDNAPEDAERLAAWLDPQVDPALQRAAVTTLGQFENAEAATTLLDAWRQLTPTLQSLTLDAILARESATLALLDRLEQNEIPPGQIDATRRQLLVNHRDESIKQRASELFAAPTGVELAALIEQYHGIEKLDANVRRGREVFTKHCATCHRLDSQGFEVGPDLAALTDKSPGYLLTAVLDPNRAIDQRYSSYAAVTQDGQVFTGLLANESANSITIKAQDGKEQVILRGDLEELVNTSKSYMPEGLAREIPPPAMADLLAYVAAGGLQPRYRYLESTDTHTAYQDDTARPKLADADEGGDRFDNGRWVGFKPAGDEASPQLVFDLRGKLPEEGGQLALEAIRVVYGVNHRPGGIHAPTRVRIALSSDGKKFGEPIEFSEFDDTPDGKGAFELARRTALVPLGGREALYVRLDFYGDSEWIFLSEIGFEGSVNNR